MEDINFTSGAAPRMRLERNGKTGIDVDFFDETNGEHLAGRYLNDKDVKELVQFLVPTPSTGLEVGDRVRVLVAVSRMNQNLTPGTEGTVENAKDKSGAVGVRMDDGRFVSLNPGDMVLADTTTERVSVSLQEDLYVGDVIVENDPAKIGVVVERKVPVKPAEPEFGYGTAYVFGAPAPQKRYRGFKSKAGWFYFLHDDGRQGMATVSQYEGFRLED